MFLSSAVYDKASRATDVVTDIVDSNTVTTVITISYNLYFYCECCAGGSGLAMIMMIAIASCSPRMISRASDIVAAVCSACGLRAAVRRGRFSSTAFSAGSCYSALATGVALQIKDKCC